MFFSLTQIPTAALSASGSRV